MLGNFTSTKSRFQCICNRLHRLRISPVIDRVLRQDRDILSTEHTSSRVFGMGPFRPVTRGRIFTRSGEGILSSVSSPRFKARAASPAFALTSTLASSFTSTSPSTMATPYKIRIPVDDTGLLKFPQNETTANATSELLQKDLEVRDALATSYHMYSLILSAPPVSPRFLQHFEISQPCISPRPFLLLSPASRRGTSVTQDDADNESPAPPQTG